MRRNLVDHARARGRDKRSGGLDQEDVARPLEISTRTVQRELRLAREWLHRELV